MMCPGLRRPLFLHTVTSLIQPESMPEYQPRPRKPLQGFSRLALAIFSPLSHNNGVAELLSCTISKLL